MLKHILLLTILLSHYFQLPAQISNLVFLGTASVKNSITFTYKLQVSDSDNVLRGYSVTDLKGPNETKTAVTGSIDVAKKIVNIREMNIIYTKSPSSPSDFCFINSQLKISKMQGMTILKGPFKGYKPDGKTKCAEGRLMLASAQDVLDKLMKIATEDSLALPAKDSIRKEIAPMQVVYEKEIPDEAIKKIKAGETLNLTCSSKEIKIELWDAKTIDGDKVTLTQENTILLENFTISGKHKNISFSMEDRPRVTVRLTAINEGSEPMNTARMKIVSGTHQYYIDAIANAGGYVEIVLLRE